MTEAVLVALAVGLSFLLLLRGFVALIAATSAPCCGTCGEPEGTNAATCAECARHLKS